MCPALVAALGVLALLQSSLAFVPIGGGASTHVSITGTAVLQKLKETCKAVAESSGHEFNPTGPSAEELVQACLGPTAAGDVSAAKFRAALQEIYVQNGLVDRDFVNSAAHHFNSEAFLEGRALITEGVVGIKANIRNKNFQAAREMLGRVLHTLQDFYSHSNWVELGYTEPYGNLIHPDLPIENIAAKDTPTCIDCASGTCPDPILANILQEKKLTSGYMGIFSNEKPKGKCSHGGAADLTSAVVPRGGISKDERRPDNGAVHATAVKLATSASLQLLEDIRGAAGDSDFLRLMGIARSAVVCFVVDTTGSMTDDIVEARRVIYDIIDSRKGTQDEPSEYILVPFNDPAFGPMTRTTDPEVMKRKISALKANGGGDLPEMCLSGLQLAMTGAPASSHIYVFTDAVAKDIDLKDTIVALIRSTKSTVSFFMTGARRRRRSLRASFNDYKDLALASGGQAIQVSKGKLPEATDVILDTSTSALVTVLQRSRSSGEETFTFLLDESLKNITLYITATSITFTLTNPAGVKQSNIELNGHLGTIQNVGNLWRIRLDADNQTGLWKIKMLSSQPYTLKVTGQNIITFIYDFVAPYGGPHPGYAPITGRPQAGQPATLLLSVMGRKGPSSITVGEVGLIPVSRVEAISNGSTTDMGNGDILVKVDTIPQGEFVVIMTGTDSVSNSQFQRQSTTQMSVSKVTIQAVVDSSVEPGQTLSIPFSVMTQGSGGTFSINARNDRNYPMKFPKSVTLMTGEYGNYTLAITPPANTPTGTDITLTIEAKSSRASAADSNYVVLRLSVVTKITDFVRPMCEVVLVAAEDCPKNVSWCASFRWNLSANLTDGNGTGIDSVTLRQGDGVFTHTSLSDLDVQASYNASCCSEIVEFVAVDKNGNVGRCYHSIAQVVPTSGPATTGPPSGGPPSLGLAQPLWLCLLLGAFMART